MEGDEIFEMMAEGNEVAGQVLVEIITKHKRGFDIILDMDDMNIRGTQIVLGVQAVCGNSIKSFVDMVEKRHPFLVDEINKHYTAHKAVVKGASFGERE